jgi:preprotein translocase subunit SecG
MANVLIVAYLLIVLAMIAVILLQRSEGGGLGIGGSSTGLITVRGSANLLTRTTAILAALFFATAIGLTILSEVGRTSRGILEQAADSVGTGTEAITQTNVLDALNQLQAQSSGGTDTSLPVPQAPEGTPETTPAPATNTAAPAAPAADTAAPAQPMTPPASEATRAPAEPAAVPAAETPAPADPALDMPAAPTTAPAGQ